MPEGGGDWAIVRAIQLRVRYPKSALRDCAQGQSVVSFAVAPSGQVCQVKLERPLRPDLDSAVVQAVRLLPPLQPAQQHGHPVACLLRAPITFYIDNPVQLPRRPLPALDSSQVYSAVMRMPLYQGRFANTQLAADWVAEYLRVTNSEGCAIPRGGAGIVVTVSPSGLLSNVQLLPADPAQSAALKARFGDQVARLEDPEDKDLDEACLPQLAEAARRLPRLTPAYLDGHPVAARLFLSLFNPKYPR